MMVFGGIDLGKITTLGIVSVDDSAKITLVDTMQIDLARGEPKPVTAAGASKRKTGKKRKTKGKSKGEQAQILAKRLVKLDDFLDSVLKTWNFTSVAIEVPPSVRNLDVFQQLSMLYGLSLSRLERCSTQIFAYPVSQWRKLVKINTSTPKGLRQQVREDYVKRTVIGAVNKILGSDFEIKQHDRADAAGIAVSAAVAKGVVEV